MAKSKNDKFKMDKLKTEGPISQEVESGVEYVSIDIQIFLMPISILLSTIILSTSIFFTFNGTSVSLGSASAAGIDSEDSYAGQEPSVAGAQDPGVAGSTTIDDDPILGDRDSATVAIVEFSDYECPFCKRFHDETYDQIVENYIDTGKAILVYRDFPLSFHDPLATTQAMAAECVQDISGDKKYFEYSKSIYATTQSNGQGMEIDKLYDLAEDIGVDGGKVKSCVESEKFKDEILNDIADGGSAGVTGTPGFIIGVLSDDGTVEGVNVAGAQPYSVFEQLIEEQLEEAK